MSDTVLKRTCFYDMVGGTIRPYEWSHIIVEGFGPMVEVGVWPFECNFITMNQGSKSGGKENDDFSSSNGWQRVDEFVQADDAKVIKTLNCGDESPWLHGGRHFPRTGR